MAHFLHTSVRLYSDVRRSYKRFTEAEELHKWLVDEIQGEVSVGCTLSGVFKHTDLAFSEVRIIELEKETSMRFTFPVSLVENDPCSNAYEVEIKFMQCTSETYYCTEIHLMQHGFDGSEASMVNRELYLVFWKERLDYLRKLINKDWIIQDSELTLRCFR